MTSLRAIQWFAAVVDAGGFTQAAQTLRTTQPAVSTTIKRLEDDLGVTLLTRSTRRVTLTSEGARFLEHARAILGHLSAANRDLAALKSLETGRIAIGAPPMVAGYLLPRILDAFLAAHPGIRVVVVQAGADEIAQRVARETLDLGIIADWRRPSGLITRAVESHPIVACLSRANALSSRDRCSWAELLQQPLIAFPRGYYQRALLDDAAHRLRIVPNIVVEAESIPLIAELVRRGRGVATLLQATAHELSGVRCVALPKEAVVPIAVCRSESVAPSLAARAFEALLLRTVRSAR